MNIGLQFYKWILSKNKNKLNAEDLSREICRSNWDEFGEKVIKRALNHSACTSYQSFRQLCKHYKDETK